MRHANTHADGSYALAVRVVAAVDKFRGTASAAEVAKAIGHACWQLGFDCEEVPVADGGEGTLDALGGPNRTSTVTGPLGDPVQAEWRMQRNTAIIEMARSSGLSLVGGREGAKKIIVCLGGSATTDGGLGAVRAIHAPNRLRGVDLLVACDVTTLFTDAGKVFGPQKGATPAQVKLLTGRLERPAQIYRAEFGVDVLTIEGAGAAGGLAGGLAALGGRLVPGFDLVADELDLYDRIVAADVVVTGEGFLDPQSFEGKVVGRVQQMAAELGKPVGAVVGDADPSVVHRIPNAVMAQLYGLERAFAEPLWCIEHAALELIPRLAELASH